MGLDASYELETPLKTPSPASDKVLQDPLDAMKQMIGRDAVQPTGKSTISDLSNAGAGTAAEPHFLDMGDTGGLYKSAVTKAHGADKTNSKVHGHGGDGSGKEVPAATHTMAKGETLEGVARKTLGPQASQQEVDRYAKTVADMNSIGDPATARAGRTVALPAHHKDGTLTYTNPKNPDEQRVVHKNGSMEARNKVDGTSFTRTAPDQGGSYTEKHTGPKATDKFDVAHDGSDHSNTTTRVDADGTKTETSTTGYKKTTDKAGNWQETYPADSQTDHASYDATSKIQTVYNRDGSTVITDKNDHHTRAVDADGTTTTKWADGKVVVQKKDAQGHEVGNVHEPDGAGGYKEHAWGPQTKDNYDETYNAQTGTTTRVEAKGRPEEKTTTKLKDGTVKVEAKDGKNYQKNPDGSEHHWGKENYDKPAYDYDKDPHLKQAKEVMNKAVNDHIPADKQQAYRDDMDAFEKRAQADHLSPEEVAKTYEQMSKLLNADNSKSVVKAPERALLAEGLMHQIAFPSDTDQGVYNTCNVTTVAEKTMTKNPSKAAEMVATTALTGQWTAADGKVIKIDPGSLTPGVQESVDPHVENTRSYATQVLNLVMANDALQRRVPPETYVQRKPDHSVPGDSGERRLDASGHEIKTMQWDPKNDTWKSLPDDSPALTDHEIAQVGARLNGHENHLISPGNGQSGVDDVRGVEQFEARLHQFQQQGEFPITINVDGNHAPIPVGNETPGIGNHVVTIDGYDENTHEVHISNQWGVASDKWVAVKDLYNNSKTVHPLDDDSNQDH